MAAKSEINDCAEQLPANAGSILLNVDFLGSISSPNESEPSTRSRLSNESSHYSSQPSPAAGGSQLENAAGNSQAPVNRNRGRRRGMTSQRIRPHERWQENQRILEDLFTTKQYTKYFLIRSTNGSNLAESNVVQAYREMTIHLKGKPKKVNELRDGTLLVEVASEEQSKLIRTLKKLDRHEVQVTEHPKLNQVQGTIRYRNQPNYSNEEIVAALSDSNVTAIYQVKKKVAGQLQPTNIYIVTFNLCHLPKDVHIGWTKCEVREYIPRPRRCFNCQGFGHGGRSCRQDGATCVKCGEAAHDECPNESKCKNCNENHPASSTACFYYKLETETLTIQTREKCSYWEAKSAATKKMVNPTYASTTSGVSLTTVTPRTPNTPQTIINEMRSPRRTNTTFTLSRLHRTERNCPRLN